MIERTFIKKNFNKMEIETYLSKKLERAGFSKLEIIKTPLVTRIVLHVAKPGLAIGKSGSTIKELTETMNTKFKIDNPQIEIQEIKNANLDAKILSQKMASMIERGFAWRSVSFRMVRDIMNAGAQGVELVFKGKLAGKGGRKRKQRIAIGYMKKIGDQAKYVDTAKAAAYPKAGAIGITLSIIHPEVIFPDKIDVNEVVGEIKKAKLEKEEQAEKANEESTTKTEETTDDKKVETKKEKATEKKDEKVKETKKEEKEVKHHDKKVVKKEKTEEKKESVIDKAAHAVEEAVEKIEDVAEKVSEEIKEDIEKVEEKLSGKKETKKEEKK